MTTVWFIGLALHIPAANNHQPPSPALVRDLAHLLGSSLLAALSGIHAMALSKSHAAYDSMRNSPRPGECSRPGHIMSAQPDAAQYRLQDSRPWPSGNNQHAVMSPKMFVILPTLTSRPTVAFFQPADQACELRFSVNKYLGARPHMPFLSEFQDVAQVCKSCRPWQSESDQSTGAALVNPVISWRAPGFLWVSLEGSVADTSS